MQEAVRQPVPHNSLLMEDPDTRMATGSAFAREAKSDRERMVDALVHTHDWCYRIVRVAVGAGHGPFGRMWHGGGERRADRTRQWIASHGEQMRAVLGLR